MVSHLEEAMQIYLLIFHLLKRIWIIIIYFKQIVLQGGENCGELLKKIHNKKYSLKNILKVRFSSSLPDQKAINNVTNSGIWHSTHVVKHHKSNLKNHSKAGTVFS